METTAVDQALKFIGRILFLSANPDAISRQLAGADLTLADCEPLRDNVSTDEITPVTVMMTYDERLGRYPYVGFKAGDALPVGENTVRNGGFEVTVAGERYGKGSSRESSPLAEKSAGIRLIIARSFERIYRQNCDNIGILTTDFGILDRIVAGEAIPFEEFLAGRDEVTRDVIRAGGLLPYSKLHLPKVTGKHFAPIPTSRPLTLAEKIIARRKVLPEGEAATGDGIILSADWRFSHDYFTGMCAHFMHEAFGDDVTLERPDEIIAFQDHLVLVNRSYPHVKDNMVPAVEGLFDGHRHFAAKYPVRSHGQLKGEEGVEGICHAMMAETYALPGQVVVGTDSHTPHSGSLGCLAFGAGATDIANSWATGLIRCKMPEIVRIEVVGNLKPGMSARDIVQYLLQTEFVRTGKAIGMVFEYTGPVVKAMSMDERATLTNMMAEMGGFTGVVEPDDKTVAFLRERRGVEFAIEDWMRSDAGAAYKDVITVDCDSLSPMVARPGDPGNAVPLATLEEPVALDIAFGGSCTAGKRKDVDIYHEVLKWGLDPIPFTLQFCGIHGRV
ncbi:3-isopropylmalate dehydratase large subunit [Skermanella stibiiresistens SB22]|uniref:3-isopropylmalate dehydratase large subunit n=1 Tax=Skermanella stibiiresistens SB22 TaxID=1385369 RepID=W9GTN7_9PROT|nr:3-isopropylmalate dehydratase large subunit [Skermanella stibiiresistens SB22]